MRLTIIPKDAFVAVDGLSFNEINMSSIDAAIHAVQWYGTYGEIEMKDIDTGKMVANIYIDSLDDFVEVLADYQAKKDIYDAELAEQAAFDQIHEV